MTEPTIWKRIAAAPGWQTLYRQLRHDVAALDPHARFTVRVGTGMLHLHVVQSEAAVEQPIRDPCFDAEGESMRTCQICGRPGQPRALSGEKSIATLCEMHAELARRVQR